MSPEKIAMAVAVTMAATAGTGAMKNVTGTSSAVAIVAVRPGTAPTKSPKSAEQKITHSTYGSKTSANAAAKLASMPLTWSRSAVDHLKGQALEHTPGKGD